MKLSAQTKIPPRHISEKINRLQNAPADESFLPGYNAGVHKDYALFVVKNKKDMDDAIDVCVWFADGKKCYFLVLPPKKNHRDQLRTIGYVAVRFDEYGIIYKSRVEVLQMVINATGRRTMSVLPRHMYGDPMYAAMKAEETRCTGCKHLEKVFGRELCGVGRRELKKCRRFETEKGV